MSQMCILPDINLESFVQIEVAIWSTMAYSLSDMFSRTVMVF